jgi:hypothetical protein
MIGSMVLDAKFALGEKFSASRFWDECRKHDAVSFNTLGAMISILLKQPPRSDDRDHPVRVVVDAGCQPGAWERFRDRFGVRLVEWFGMVDSPGILLNTEDKPGPWASASPAWSSGSWTKKTTPCRPASPASSSSSIPKGSSPTTTSCPSRPRNPTLAAGSTPATSPSWKRTASSTTRGAKRSPCAAGGRTSPPGR